MKDHKDKLSSLGAASLDEGLGNVLSAVLAEAETDECVGAEVIAGLADGAPGAGSRERDKVMKHLSSCDTCYDVYMLTADLLAEEERKEEKRNIIRFRIKPLALAASILIAAAAMYLFFRVGEIPRTVDQLVKMPEPKEEARYRQPAPAAPEEKKMEFFEEKARDKPGVKAQEKGEKRLRAVPPKKGGRGLDKKKIVPVTVPVEEGADMPVERQGQRKEREAKITGTKVYGPKRKPTRVMHAGKQKIAFDPDSYRLDRLKKRLLSYESAVPGNELTLLFRETVALTGQLKETFKRLRKEAVKTGDFKPMETLVRRAAAVPPLTLVKGEETVYIYPDMGYFLSKSIPGSAEYRFFSLAAAGWCGADGVCYSYGRGRAGIGPKSSLKERETREKKIEPAGKQDKIIAAQERKKRLAKWETLYPELKGIYRGIAFHTINHLKAFKE
jgi:hypothetical protein